MILAPFDVTPWSAWDRQIATELHGLRLPFVREQVRLAAIDFCKRSWVWLADQSADVFAGSSLYRLPALEPKYIKFLGVATHRLEDAAGTGGAPTTQVDLRMLINPADATPGTAQCLAGSWTTSPPGNTRRWRVDLTALGHLLFTWSVLGDSASGSETSSVPVPFTGAPLWVGIKADVALSPQGTVDFSTSLDYDPDTLEGTWTPLGVQQLTGAPTSILSSGLFEIGSFNDGVSSRYIGDMYYAELRATINGGVAFVCDPREANVGAPSFVSTLTGETWFVQGSGGVSVVIDQANAKTEIAHILKVWIDKEPIFPKTRNELSDLYGDFSQVEGAPKYFVQDTSGRLILVPKPTDVGALTAKVAIAPTLLADGIETSVYERHFEAITNGAKARLYAMPKKPWSSLDHASAYAAAYEDAIAAAKTTMIRSYAGARLRNRAQFY